MERPERAIGWHCIVDFCMILNCSLVTFSVEVAFEACKALGYSAQLESGLENRELKPASLEG